MNRILCAFFFSSSVLLSAQTTSISGTINSYASVINIACQSLDVVNSNGFAPGDRVLLIQMQGAVIDSTNTPAFGTILNYNNAGNYEMATIQAISGNTVILTDSVLRKYNVSDNVQLVKVPVYANADVTGPLTCQAWNGSSGGVLALQVTGVLTLNADIDISGTGFRGATLFNGSLVSCQGDTSNYFLPTGSTSSAHKGEGIVTYKASRADGKGANANGGGGGHDCNGGGAGGGNYGSGGYGGDSKCNVSCPQYFYQNSGGEAGRKLTYSNFINKIFLGGGGGAGHQNNNGGSPGTNGGGIIFIKADSIAGANHFIRTDGINNVLIANIDGQGGGGAGGTVLFVCRAFSNLNVSVQGGYGGVDNFAGTDCHGKGGGGAGGIIWASAPIVNGVTQYLAGGSAGVFTSSGSLCYNGSNGASAGQNGGSLIDLIVPESTAPCLTDVNLYSYFKKPCIYPSPVNQNLTVAIAAAQVNSSYRIVDQLGRSVIIGTLTSEITRINVSDLPAGLYILQVGDGVTRCEKFVKD